MDISTTRQLVFPGERSTASNIIPATPSGPELPREIWTRIFVNVSLLDLWYTCRLVSRDFNKDSEFIIRTTIIARGINMIFPRNSYFTFSHFGNKSANTSHLVYLKPSPLPEASILCCEVKGLGRTRYLDVEGWRAYQKMLRWPTLLLRGDGQSVESQCYADIEKQRFRAYDLKMGHWRGTMMLSTGGCLSINWRRMFTIYLYNKTVRDMEEEKKRKRNALLNRARVKFGLNFRRPDDPQRWDAQVRKVGWLHSREDQWVEFSAENE